MLPVPNEALARPGEQDKRDEASGTGFSFPRPRGTVPAPDRKCFEGLAAERILSRRGMGRQERGRRNEPDQSSAERRSLEMA
jgi:hypothetical protein